MSESTIELVYEGDAVTLGTMDVLDLAPALLAFGELCQEANRVINGGRSELTVSVSSDFEGGSFTSKLVLVAQQAADHLSLENLKDAKAIVDLIWGKVSLVGLLKWMKSRQPKTVQPLPDGSVRVEIQAASGWQVIVNNYPKEVLELANSAAVRRRLKLVMGPLQRPGIDRMKVLGDSISSEPVTKAETVYFEPPPEEVEAHVDTRETLVEIIKPSFRKDLKWVFSEGGGNFSADIEDEDFLNAVKERRHSFTAGDYLRVRLWKRSVSTPNGLRADFKIQKVLGVQQAPKQILLPEH